MEDFVSRPDYCWTLSAVLLRESGLLLSLQLPFPLPCSLSIRVLWARNLSVHLLIHDSSPLPFSFLLFTFLPVFYLSVRPPLPPSRIKNIHLSIWIMSALLPGSVQLGWLQRYILRREVCFSKTCRQRQTFLLCYSFVIGRQGAELENNVP